MANRVNKIAQITDEVNITRKYCPTQMNLADLGNRGASIDKLHNHDWFTVPEWLLNKENLPEQPEMKKNLATHQDHKVIETVFLCEEKEADEWDELLDRSAYWRTVRVTALILRIANTYRHNSDMTIVVNVAMYLICLVQLCNHLSNDTKFSILRFLLGLIEINALILNLKTVF